MLYHFPYTGVNNEISKSLQPPSTKGQEQSNYVFDVTVVGEYGVGKTSLLQRYVYNSFNPVQPPTFGIDFYAKFVQRDSMRIKLKCWDTPGRLSPIEVFPSCFREADVIVLVYDLTKLTTFHETLNWLRVAQRNSRKGVRFFLVGSKCEMENREVSLQEIQKFASQNMLPAYEISAHVNSGIQELFNDIVDELIRTNPVRIMHRDTIRVKRPELNPGCVDVCCST